MSKITSVRGMNDLPPEEVRVWTIAEETIKKVFNSYGYEEIRFPIVEKTELFTRSNESADIVTKEMYTFKDKNEDFLTLRPEYTTPMIRAAISNNLLEKLDYAMSHKGVALNDPKIRWSYITENGFKIKSKEDLIDLVKKHFNITEDAE